MCMSVCIYMYVCVYIDAFCAWVSVERGVLYEGRYEVLNFT